MTVVEDANSITKGIVNFLKSKGHCARRINTTGIWDPKKKLFRKAAETGTSDVIAALRPVGRMLAVEVKFGDDVQSPEQKEFQSEVEDAGGIYLIIKTYDEWLQWWDDNIVFDCL